MPIKRFRTSMYCSPMLIGVSVGVSVGVSGERKRSPDLSLNCNSSQPDGQVAVGQHPAFVAQPTLSDWLIPKSSFSPLDTAECDILLYVHIISCSHNLCIEIRNASAFRFPLV